jgi:hypothetical protein
MAVRAKLPKLYNDGRCHAVLPDGSRCPNRTFVKKYDGKTPIYSKWCDVHSPECVRKNIEYKKKCKNFDQWSCNDRMKHNQAETILNFIDGCIYERSEFEESCIHSSRRDEGHQIFVENLLDNKRTCSDRVRQTTQQKQPSLQEIKKGVLDDLDDLIDQLSNFNISLKVKKQPIVLTVQKKPKKKSETKVISSMQKGISDAEREAFEKYGYQPITKEPEARPPEETVLTKKEIDDISEKAKSEYLKNVSTKSTPTMVKLGTQKAIQNAIEMEKNYRKIKTEVSAIIETFIYFRDAMNQFDIPSMKKGAEGFEGLINNSNVYIDAITKNKRLVLDKEYLEKYQSFKDTVSKLVELSIKIISDTKSILYADERIKELSRQEEGNL